MLDETVEKKDLIQHVRAFHANGAIRPCCQKPENLTREHTIPQRPNEYVRLCRVCQRRHFRMKAEGGILRLPKRPEREPQTTGSRRIILPSEIRLPYRGLWLPVQR